MVDLKLAQTFVDEMNQTNSSLDKKAVLAKYPQLQPLLKAVYDPFMKFGVTPAGIKKISATKGKKQAPKRVKAEALDLFELLRKLSSRQLTGHAAVAAVQSFIDANSEHADLIYKIIDKDLKIGVSGTSINDVFPNLVPSFEVILANDFQKYANKIDFVKDTWFASRKLDGCRCIIVIDGEGDIKFLSRAGNEFETLDAAKPEISSLGLRSMVLDSEACILNPDGSENFAAVVGQIKRKNYTIPAPRIYLFDMVTLDEFGAGAAPDRFSVRQQRLDDVMRNYAGQMLVHLPQTVVENAEELAGLSDEAAAKGWEGLILRKDVPYEAKRSNDTLKVKRFLDAEFTVLACEMGKKQMLRNGQKVEVDTLGSVVIEYRGNRVNCGSGFSDAEREKIFADPSCIIGKQITVQYFEETENKKGTVSMRFPTKKTIWWEPRDT